MSIKPWKTLTTREVYKNPWIRVREDIAEMPNGRTTLYGVCEMGACAGVLPFVDDEHVMLVRQYRYVFGEAHRWEMVTGGCKEGEAPADAAQRELMEEIGHCAGALQHINTHYTSKSVCYEIAHLFIARDLQRVSEAIEPDDTEFLEIGVLPFKDVLQMVLDSEIRDAMTVIAVLHAAQTPSPKGRGLG
jgi:ADP-ribose pyrophosphatase